MKRINIIISKVLILATFSLIATGCSNKDQAAEDNDNNSKEIIKSPYIVAVEAATDPTTHVLLPVTNFTTGEISPVNSGFQQPEWMTYFFANNKIIASGSSASPIHVSYKLVDGKLEKGGSFSTDLQVFAKTVDQNGNLLMMGSPIAGFSKKKIYVVDTETMSIINTKEVDFGNIVAEEIMSFPADMQLRDNKLFVAYYEQKSDNTKPKANTAKIAIFDYPSLEFEKIITDIRVPNLGRFLSINTLEMSENGDIYTYASSSVACGFFPVPKTNSGILRIKKGETTFDKDYHIDFEKLSGYKINDLFYVANGKAVVRILKEEENKKYEWGAYAPIIATPILETGIIDLNNKTFKLLPDVAKSGGGWPAASYVEGNKLYLGVSSKESAYIYEIDVQTETVKKGPKIKGNYAQAIFKLKE